MTISDLPLVSGRRVPSCTTHTPRPTTIRPIRAIRGRIMTDEFVAKFAALGPGEWGDHELQSNLTNPEGGEIPRDFT
jgi:hypothetical protein